MGFVGTNKQALKEAAGSTGSGQRVLQERRSHFGSHLFILFATLPNLLHSGPGLLTSLVFHALPDFASPRRGLPGMVPC